MQLESLLLLGHTHCELPAPNIMMMIAIVGRVCLFCYIFWLGEGGGKGWGLQGSQAELRKGPPGLSGPCGLGPAHQAV